MKLFSGPYCEPWSIKLLGPCSLHIKKNFESIATTAFQVWKDRHSGEKVLRLSDYIALLLPHFRSPGLNLHPRHHMYFTVVFKVIEVDCNQHKTHLPIQSSMRATLNNPKNALRAEVFHVNKREACILQISQRNLNDLEVGKNPGAVGCVTPNKGKCRIF